MLPATTPKTLQAEIEREPFIPVRLHLSSGKRIDIRHVGDLVYLSYGLMVLHRPDPTKRRADGYDLINYRLIERVEQLGNGARRDETMADCQL